MLDDAPNPSKDLHVCLESSHYSESLLPKLRLLVPGFDNPASYADILVEGGWCCIPKNFRLSAAIAQEPCFRASHCWNLSRQPGQQNLLPLLSIPWPGLQELASASDVQRAHPSFQYLALPCSRRRFPSSWNKSYICFSQHSSLSTRRVFLQETACLFIAYDMERVNGSRIVVTHALLHHGWVPPHNVGVIYESSDGHTRRLDHGVAYA